VEIGYALSSEEHPANDLVRYAQEAERCGFRYASISDHFHPWIDRQGESTFVWSVMGGIAATTERLGLGTGVTCPIARYHPAIVAQQAATLQILSDGRFTLGLGAGENLNEHVVGEGWPPADVRQDMLVEAIRIIRDLFDGEGYTNFRGEHFDVESAKLWDLPEKRVPIGVAVSGQQSCEIAGEHADAMIGVEPKPELSEYFEAAGGSGKPRIGQMPISFDTDRDAAVQRAHSLFRWFGFGWKVNAELPGPSAFDAAAQFVRPEDVAENIPCGPDLDKIVEAVSAYWKAGFTDIAVVQVGDEKQDQFLEEAAGPLLEKLRSAAP
jgi:G6PDH family F420-dependent oxidoreductase